MARCVLVSAPLPDLTIAPMPLLGPAVLKGHLEARGHSVDLVDLCARVRHRDRFRGRRQHRLDVFFDRPDALQAHLEGTPDPAITEETEKLVRLGRLDQYETVGFSVCLDSGLGPLLCIAQHLKKARRPPTIILGGPVFARSDFRYLLEHECIDAIVIGDGEEAMVRVLEEGLGPAPGLEMRGTMSTPAAFPLDQKARPIFHPGDIERYASLALNGRSWLPYLLTRGCRYRCSFCRDYDDVRFTYTPTEKVVDEIAFLQRSHGVDAIYFGESNINNDDAAIVELCEEILRRDLRIKWGGLGTIWGLEPDVIDLMSKAGCRFLSVGIETASERLRKKWNIGKCRDLGEIEQRLARMHAVGIRINSLFIVGLPHETEDEHRETMDFLGLIAPYCTTVGASEFELIEGSPAHMRQNTFSVKSRERSSPGRYAFLDRHGGFDEVGGSRWEDKRKRATGKLVRFNRLARLKVGLPLAMRLWREDPLYLVKRAARRPYFDYGVYL